MLLSQRKYAEHRKAQGLRGGTLAAVQKAIASGRIQINADGLIDATTADAAWSENTNPAKVQTTAAPEVKAPAGPSIRDQQLQLLEEKTLTARTKRLMLQGDVIAVADAEAATGEMVEVAKRILLRMPDALSIRMAASKDPAECRSILEYEVRQALAAIQDELAA